MKAAHALHELLLISESATGLKLEDKQKINL
jgi:hypothetical protein